MKRSYNSHFKPDHEVSFKLKGDLMINKKLFKKTLAGTMLAIIACTSMNATANPHWKWVGYLGAYNDPYRTATVDEHCEGAVKGYADFRRDPNIAYTGTHYLYANSTIQCGMSGYPGAESTGFSPACGEVPGSFWPGSYYDQENYDKGCFVDCDPNKYPNGGMPEACNAPEPKPDEKTCEKAREDLLNNGTPLPESCSEFPENDKLCDGKVDINPKTNLQTEFAGVACEPKATCFWPDAQFDNLFHDKQARQIIRSCFVKHENYHANDVGQCVDYRWGPRNQDEKRTGENMAYAEEVKCLQEYEPVCDNNQDPQQAQACKDDLEKRRCVAEYNGWGYGCRGDLQCIKSKYPTDPTCD